MLPSPVQPQILLWMAPDDPLQRPGKAFGDRFAGVRPVGILLGVDDVFHFDPVFQRPTDSGCANHQHWDLVFQRQESDRLVRAGGAAEKVDKYPLGARVLIGEGGEFPPLGQYFLNHFKLALLGEDFLPGSFPEAQ